MHAWRMPRPTHRSSARLLGGDLIDDVGGAVYVEYVALLTLVTLIGAGAVAALGLPLLRMFRFAEIVIALPVP